MATETQTIPRAGKSSFTTIQLTADTKRKLDELREAITEGKGSYEELVRRLIERATSPDTGPELGRKLVRRMEALERIVGAMLTDPDSGYLFLATAEHRHIMRGVDGVAGKPREGFFATGNERGAYVYGPSSRGREDDDSLLTESDGTLPEGVVKAIRRDERKASKARAAEENDDREESEEGEEDEEE